LRLLRIFLAGVALLASFAPPSSTGQRDQRVEIINLRYHTHAAFTRIVIDIGQLREYISGELKEPGRIYVDVLQAMLNPILQGQAHPLQTDYITQIRIGQKTESTVRVVADIDREKVQSYRVYHIFDPFRIVIDIYPLEGGRGGSPASTQAGGDTPPGRPPDPNLAGYSMARQLGLGVKTVVIDPGHGGGQPGCVGKSGLREKDITLDVALRLRKILREEAGLEAVLTRESDITVPLEDRTVIANQKRADLFVSIHVNAHRDRKREGAETFFLNFNADPAVTETAALENATSTKNIGEMREIIQKIVRNSKIQESRALAEQIQKNLVQSLSRDHASIKDLGVKGGPFWVLIGGEMPSVLVEISHLSNAREEAKLKTGAYRDLAARGIYEGIMAYVRSLGKG
jgi:N-acetylmuramoyl-L-alanine amidase